MSVDAKLLEILACPACRGDIRALPADGGLECMECGRIYPIRDGIPVMLIDEASEPQKSPDSGRS